jgi:hypothetical protein
VDDRLWSIGGLKLTGDAKVCEEESIPVPLVQHDFVWTGKELNLDLVDYRLTTDRISHGTKHSLRLHEVASLLHIFEVSVSNLSKKTDYPDNYIFQFASFRHGKCRNMLQIIPRTIPPTSVRDK